MDNELIERLARDAGFDPPDGDIFLLWDATDAALHRFARSVFEAGRSSMQASIMDRLGDYEAVKYAQIAASIKP